MLPLSLGDDCRHIGSSSLNSRCPASPSCLVALPILPAWLLSNQSLFKIQVTGFRPLSHSIPTSKSVIKIACVHLGNLALSTQVSHLFPLSCPLPCAHYVLTLLCVPFNRCQVFLSCSTLRKRSSHSTSSQVGLHLGLLGHIFLYPNLAKILSGYRNSYPK